MDAATFAVTERAVFGEAHVADLARVAPGSGEEASACDDARAESRAAGEENEVACSLTRAPTPLGERAGVGVVDQGDGFTEVGGKPGDERGVFPTGQVGRGKQTALREVERPAARDAHAVELAAKTQRGLADEAAGFVGCGGRELGAGVDLAGGVAEHDGGLSAAEVDAEEEIRGLLAHAWNGCSW